MKRAAKEWVRVLELSTAEERFLAIYHGNLWGSVESVSGYGSTLQFTENLRDKLPKLFSDYSVKKVFDAPCGDFNWMKHLLRTVHVDYVGADIVSQLIATNQERYQSYRISFIHLNLITDDYPEADLMICRDCLSHLSYEDTKSLLQRFVDSRIHYLLTTTYRGSFGFENRDIETGAFRYIDLLRAPYNFPSPPLMVIDDWLPPEPERQMSLWSREQVASVLKNFNMGVASMGDRNGPLKEK
jgi:hypothetical protein